MLKIKFKQTCLLLGDILLLYGALYATLTIRYFSLDLSDIWATSGTAFTPVFILWIAAFYFNNLYNLKIFAQKNKFIESSLRAIGIAAGLAIIYFYLRPNVGISPKTNLLIFTVIFGVLFIAWRYGFYLFIKNQLPRNNLAAVGYNSLLKELADEFRLHPQLGYEVKFVIDDNNPDLGDNRDIKIFSTNDDLEQLISKFKINALILEKDLSHYPDLQKKLFNCLPLGVSYITLAEFYEKITGRVPLDIINQNWFLANLDLADKKIFEAGKRFSDFIGAGIGLIISIPFWPLIALAIKLESKGPIFFKQMRLGKNNIPFLMTKFRTMKTVDNNFGITEKEDPRITKIGSFLRKTRIDEIPQVLNILKGQMSFIGPRPERPELAAKLEAQIPFYNIRTLVKPGITGWDQVSGEYHSADVADTFVKLQHDIFYIKNRSLWVETVVVLKTLRTIFAHQGR